MAETLGRRETGSHPLSEMNMNVSQRYSDTKY